MKQTHFDVVIGGAGPVGCATALACAQSGARVLLVDAAPNACRRFAGEWLHPLGVETLMSLLTDAERTRLAPLLFPGDGFCVHDRMHQRYTRLTYRQHQAMSFEHGDFVMALRDIVQRRTNVTLETEARMRLSPGQQNCVIETASGYCHLTPQTMIAATGKAALPDAGRRRQDAMTISSMGGLVLHDVSLPDDAFGHVFLGGPGPILAYRIGENAVRLSIDVPAACAELRKDPNQLFQAIAPALPDNLAMACARALGRQKIQWAATGLRPRTHFAMGHLRLVGDAAGFLHPLTASGITLGLQDAVAVPTMSARAYEKTRRQHTYVPELLANALYRVFSETSDSAMALRDGVFRNWQNHPDLRALTMDLLACEETSPRRFAEAFARIGLETTWTEARRNRQRAIPKATGLRAMARWADWPLAGILPQPIQHRYRHKETPVSPLAWPHVVPEPHIRSPKPMYTLEQDLEFCRTSLNAVSRTFSQPIAALEGDLRTAVMCGYLLCRIADTVEDSPDIRPEVRNHLYDQFLRVLDEEIDAKTFARVFPKDNTDDPEVLLARNTDRVWRVLETLPEEMQKTCRRWIMEMTRGMMIYSNRSHVHSDGLVALLTPGDLERYCYFVAGTVGYMLTELFTTQLGDRLSGEAHNTLLANAEGFGMGLQMVNIIKDITEDRERGVSFVPRSTVHEGGLDLNKLTDPTYRAKAHAAVKPLMQRAHSFLDQALEYTLAIPAEATDVRLFCLLPLWMAVLTLHEAEDNDALFAADQDVKITREAVAEVITTCRALAADDTALRQAYAEMKTGRQPELKLAAS